VKLSTFASWFVPYGLLLARRKAFQRRALAAVAPQSVIEANRQWKDAHLGQSCVLLANGPSAAQFDLTSIAGTTTFSVSNGYLHAGYDKLRPAYHCVPQITYGRMTEEDVVRWFEEMHSRLFDATLFLSDTEFDVVQRHNLFPGRKVYYLSMRGDFDDLEDQSIPDIGGTVPRGQSVPIMVLLIAMYMGFKSIAMLGVDHDTFLTRRYTYAFEPSVQKGKDFSVSPSGFTTSSRYEELREMARLWHQYRSVRNIAERNGVLIVNANPDSALDEFPFVDLTQGI